MRMKIGGEYKSIGKEEEKRRGGRRGILEEENINKYM
jgi:hypothetical protein